MKKSVPRHIIFYRITPACLILFFLLLNSCKKDLLSPVSRQQVQVPTQQDLNRILFVNDTLGFIAGGEKYLSSELLTTTDGGRTWTPFTFNQGDEKAIYGLATNGATVYGVGYDGKIYIRQANGWLKLQTQYWEWFQALAFCGPDAGFIVTGEGYRGGRIYRINQFGNISQLDTFEYQLSDIAFGDAFNGYICGYGAVLKTSDAGLSWQLQNIKGDFFKSVSCIGPDQVWIVGYNGTIIHTDNGGKDWEKQRNGDNPLLKKYRLRSVAFKDTQTGYAAGDKGLLIKTTDGGKHWSEFEHFTDNDIRCITLHPDGSLWLAGAAGAVFHIKD